jgi:hypothetical protein
VRRLCVALVAALAALAESCASSGADLAGAGPLHEGNPSITEISWDCSVADAMWTLDVLTLGWTANGKLWLAKERSYVEDHSVHSIAAASDGSTDHLQLGLDIVADWRDANAGSSTAFQCTPSTEAALNARLVVYSPGGGDVGDCRSWGPDPTFFDTVNGVSSCDVVWDSDTGR